MACIGLKRWRVLLQFRPGVDAGVGDDFGGHWIHGEAGRCAEEGEEGGEERHAVATRAG